MTALDAAAYDASADAFRDHVDDDVIDLVAAGEAERGRSAADVVEAIVVDSAVDSAVDAVVVDAVEVVVVDALARDLALEDDVLEAALVEIAEPTPEPGPASKPGERHLKVAPDSVARRRRVRIAAAGAAVTISATLFAVVGFNVELAQHQIQLQHLQTQLTTEQSRYYDLRKQVAEGSSPGAIVAAAEKLGLTAGPNSYLPVAIPPPPADPTGTSDILKEIHDNAGGSLAPAQ